jgi:DtxR family Mn-dependent transcriptional regulator
MLSLTVENYLKAIKQITQKTGESYVSPGEIAAALNVAPGTVTSMLKSLADAKLAEYKPYTGVKLTPEGGILAIRLIRRHRLIEQFLVQTLNLSWDEVHEEAENMEHAMSDSLIDRIDEFLGHPEVDPHGDPIPAPDGTLRRNLANLIPLTNSAVSSRIKLVRVSNQTPEFLRMLAGLGMQIGSTGNVLEQMENESIKLEMNGETKVLPWTDAKQLLIEQIEQN